MISKACKFVGALVFASSSAVAFAAPTVLFDNLNFTPMWGWVFISETDHVAMRVSNPASASNVNQVTLKMSARPGSTGSPVVSVCSDGAGGTAPNLADCSIFTAADPVTTTDSLVRFQGSKSFAAGQSVWVVAKSSTAANEYQWVYKSGTGAAFFSLNSGATWNTNTIDYYLRVESSGQQSAPIPTTTEVGLMLMSAMLAAAAWFASRRRRQ